MRIKAGSELTIGNVYDAAARANLRGQDIHAHEVVQGKRGAITFYAYSLNGRYATGRNDGERAATWDAWGYLIAELYNLDPRATIGPYKNATDFIQKCASERDRIARYRPQDAATHTAAFLDVLTL